VFSTSDSIVAIATPPGRGGIGVVRLSGPEAHRIAQCLLSRPHALQPRYATLTTVRLKPDTTSGTDRPKPGTAYDTDRLKSGATYRTIATGRLETDVPHEGAACVNASHENAPVENGAHDNTVRQDVDQEDPASCDDEASFVVSGFPPSPGFGETRRSAKRGGGSRTCDDLGL
jgi:GTP-binding protein TrmE-like protein